MSIPPIWLKRCVWALACVLVFFVATWLLTQSASEKPEAPQSKNEPSTKATQASYSSAASAGQQRLASRALAATNTTSSIANANSSLTPAIVQTLTTLPLQPQQSGPAGLASSTAAKIDRDWPQAVVLAHASTPTIAPGFQRRVIVIQPQDLPYRIRLEQFVSIASDGSESVQQESGMVADHVLVQLAQTDDMAAVDTTLAALGLSRGARVSNRGLWRINLTNPLALDSLPEALAKLRETPAFRYAEPDYIVRIASTPNDTRYLDGSLWGLHNTGQNDGTADADIDAPEGWAIRNQAPDVVVGIVDTGIKLTHQDLAPNLWVNPAETADGADPDANGFIDDLHGINAIQLNGNPDDDQGHGSHVAGTIGAAGNNGVGITGVAWNVKLMGLKFLSASGGGAVSDAITCIDYGVDHGADILSNSWGGGGFSQALLDSIEAARDAGVIFVVAAGNSATDNDLAPVYPASLSVDNIVTVASTTRTDALSSFSCFGQGSVDIGAPGSDILSADFENLSGYKSLNGTSMATPHVSGVLALLRAQFPSDTWGQLINRLYRGGDSIASLADGKIANGRRLNLHGALTTTTNRPLNDDFASARVVLGDAILLRTFNRGATAEPGQPTINGITAANTIWFSFTPAASGLTSVRIPVGETLLNPMNLQTTTITYDVIPSALEVFTGSDINSLSSVGSGSDFVSFTATAGVTYRIAVAGQASAEGLVMLEVIGAPRNSTVANAIPLILNSPQSGTNRNALPEPGEPAHAGQTATASIWYKWSSNLTGRVVFSTRGTSFDTVAAAYSGPATAPTVGALTPVAANDDEIGRTTSRIEFNAIAGTTYYFALDGKAGATGSTAAVLVVPPVNDHFAEPTILSGTDITRVISTTNASREVGEPIPYPGEGRGESLWFNWTAPETGRTTIDLSGSFFPGLIGVYTGNAVNALSLVTRDGAGNRFAQVTFDATQGTTYRILVDAWDWSLNNVPLRLRMVPIPANDTFAGSSELQGLRATIVGSNVGSTRDTGEPGEGTSGGSVWYKWTAPSSGTFGIYGERLNKPDRWYVVLNVFTGSTVNALTHVKEDIGNGIGRDAFLFWDAVAGQTYHIQVTGLTPEGILGGVGPFRLDLRPRDEHVAPNDNFANALALDTATPVYNLRSHSYGTTAEPGEPAHSGFAADETLWWKFTAPDSARYVFSTALSEGSRGATVYRTTNPAAPDFTNLVAVANNVETATHLFNEVAFDTTAGTTYYIVTERMAGARGRHIVHFQRVPDNYLFAGRATITGESANIEIQNHGAVREANEPTLGASANSLGHRSLWWTWTAPSSGIYQLDTIGSETPATEDSPAYPGRTIFGFDTRLGVYTGSALGALTEVVRNDSRTTESYGNSWIDFQRNSRLEFTAVAGTTYTFLVNGDNIDTLSNPNQTNTGLVRLNFFKLPKPANDDFATAELITGSSYRTLTTTYGATKETGEPNHGGITAGRTLWWKWVAPTAGTWIISTAGNLYDDFHARRTGVGVYTGSTVNALTLVTQNQNGAGVNTGDKTWSLAQFTAVAGTTYYFGVDADIPGNLSFILDQPPANDNFANATEMVGSRWTAQGSNLGATKQTGEPFIEAWANPPDVNTRSVWWKWTAPVSGTISVDTLGSQNYNGLAVFTGSDVAALNPVSTFPYNTGNPFNGDATNRARSGCARTTFNAVAGTTYYIGVQGAGFIVPSSGPITLTLSGPPAVPFAPADFTAVRTGPATIELDWTDVAVDEEYYEIERSTNGSNWTLLHQTPPDATFHTDVTATEGSDYYYRIRAGNTVGQSAWVTASVTVPQPPPAPGSLTVTALSAHDLSITWSPAPTATSHRIERSADGGSTWTLLAAGLPGNAASHTDVGLTPSTSYQYRVRAANELGSSNWATATGATQAPGSLTLSYPESTYAETDGSFTATVTRSGTSGSQIVFLTSGSARLTVPASITIPDGQTGTTFQVTINDDAIINATDTAAITAFAPAALIGESFTGPVDAAVNTQNTGWGWNGSWYSNNTPAVLVEPSLTYTKNGTIGTPGTHALRLNSSGGTDARRFFATKYTTGDVWVSTLLHRNSTNWATQMIIRENTGGGITASVSYENNTNHWRLITSTGSNVQLLGSNPSAQVHSIVMRFDFNARQIHAWFSPDVAGASPANALGSATVAMPEALTGISRLDLFGYSVLDGFDEIRVASSFTDLYGGTTATRSLRLIDDEASPGLTPAEIWLDTHFGVTIPWGSSAWNADPDGDSVPNLLEYALADGDPFTPGTTAMPELGTTTVGTDIHLTLTVSKNPASTDISFIVETSTDLVTWQSGAGHTVVISDTATELVVRAAAPMTNNTRRFLRLRVTEGNP